MPRIKASKTVYASRSEFEHNLDKLGVLQLEIEKDIAEYNERKAIEDKKFKAALKRKKERLNTLLVGCESYVAHHREELLGDKQSGETKLSDYGYHRSPGVLKTLNSKWTFAKSMAALKEAGKTMCLKVTEALDKNATKKHIPEAELGKYGLRMDYPEEFWAQAKRAEATPEKRLTGGAA